MDWSPQAEQQLAAIWVSAVDRNAVASAGELIDKYLADKPLAFGESRSSSVHRVGYIDGFGVEFEVIEDDKFVLVNAVFVI